MLVYQRVTIFTITYLTFFVSEDNVAATSLHVAPQISSPTEYRPPFVAEHMPLPKRLCKWRWPGNIVYDISIEIWINWVCLKMVSTPKLNGFADHYPYEKWLAIIGNINPTFSGPNPIVCGHVELCQSAAFLGIAPLLSVIRPSSAAAACPEQKTARKFSLNGVGVVSNVWAQKSQSTLLSKISQNLQTSHG